jgi:histidine ammonia-lyase
VLAAMLNAGVHPVIPEIGSVGAADLGNMAGMAQVAIGQGQAEIRSRTRCIGQFGSASAIKPEDGYAASDRSA